MGMILKRSAFQLEKQTNSFLLGNSNSVDTFNFTLELCCSNLAMHLHFRQVQLWFLRSKSNYDNHAMQIFLVLLSMIKNGKVEIKTQWSIISRKNQKPFNFHATFQIKFKSNDLAGFFKDTSLRAWSGPEGIVQ